MTLEREAPRRSELEVLAWTLFGASIVTYAAARLSGADTLRWVLKPIPVLALALLVSRRRAPMIVAGLVLGAIGDVLLEPRIPALFLPGLVTFLLGHIAYVVAFTREAKALEPLRILPSVLIVGVVLALVLPALKEPPLPIILYALTIGAFAWRAAARVGHVPALPAWFGVAGALLFVSSDTLLSVNRFVAPFDFAIPCILVTYWSAQAFIALSVPREP
jgi:uncharacterized membrane protein YhhN